MRPFVIGILIVQMAPSFIVAGEPVFDRQLGFRLSVLDGFVKCPEKVQGKVILAFHCPPVGDQKAGIFIFVSRLGGVLDRKKIDPNVLAAASPHATVLEEKWKEFDIQVFRVPEQANNLQFLTFNAQVPLKPEAVQIAVFGEAARENELRSVLRSVLASLDGESNWLNAFQRGKAFGKGIAQLTITVGILTVIGVVVRRAVRRRKLSRRITE